MSSKSLHKEICSKCGKEQLIERFDSINDYHQELFSKVADKSIFDYECKFCKKIIHSPYPLLFHKMAGVDIQIGYKISPINFSIINPFVITMREMMKNNGLPFENIAERYDNEDEFANRVHNLL